jgi:hypothetical protein
LNTKNIIVPGLASGIAIFVIDMIASIIAQNIFKYNVLALGGMRAVGDPIMLLFFLYPFVIGLALAFLFEQTKKAFSGTTTQKGNFLGLLGFVVYTVPSAWIVFSSMNYPVGFTICTIISGRVAMPIAGNIIAKLSK